MVKYIEENVVEDSTIVYQFCEELSEADKDDEMNMSFQIRRGTEGHNTLLTSELFAYPHETLSFLQSLTS